MNNTLGSYIKSRRLEMGLSLRDFGKLCDISHTHIDSIEKGYDYRTKKDVNITNETFGKLASALHVPPSYLLNLSLGIVETEAPPCDEEGANGKDIKELLSLFEELSPAKRRKVIAQARLEVEEQNQQV